jgi:uncharacterized SAM-binding protein YcdF (DUF218 family)
MFFWISKILEFLYSPLTWIIIAFVFAFFLKNPKRKKRTFVAALIMLFVFTNNFLATEAMRLWEVRSDDIKKDTVYDAVIVLGGGMITYDSSNERHSFQTNTDRLMQALALFNTGKAERIIISGGSGSLIYRNMSEACLLKNFCADLGYDTTRIWAECSSDNTYQNALHTVKLINDSIPNGNFLLITSASHMRRARAVFNKAGLTFDILPANPIAGKHRWDPYFLLVPSTSALRIWDIFFKETLGYVVYKIAGYL